MSKSILQLILLLSLILILTLTFQKYLTSSNETNNYNVGENEELSSKNLNEANKINDLKNENTGISLIRNLSYEKFDLLKNTFIIKADEGLIDNDNSKKITMKNVNAEIIFQNNEKILVYSKNALFDKENFNSKFFDEVKIVFNNQILTGSILNFFFDQNLIYLKDNIIYNNLNTTMYADEIIIDLATKETKILSSKVNNKIKIIKE